MNAYLAAIEMNLKGINALCTNPHWTAERRWRVEQLSREAMTALRQYITEENARAPVDSSSLR